MLDKKQPSTQEKWVRETSFGKWFLSTDTWFRYVLSEAIGDFSRLLKDRTPESARILDAGCGRGLSFSLLEQHFHPQLIVGVDIDNELIETASDSTRSCQCEVQLKNSSVHKLDFPDNSFDMVLCHQLIHHIYNQAGAVAELYRVLAPGGFILVSESCRPFINSFPVRLLFRHPMDMQKTAREYVELVKAAGFSTNSDDVVTRSPWWSKKDLGLMSKLGLTTDSQRQAENSLDEATEVLIVAKKV